MDQINRIEDITDPNKIVGYTIIATEDKQLATSDVDLSAFLTVHGVLLCGTVTRVFNSRGRKKTKVFLVFEMGPELTAALAKWSSEVGGEYKNYRYTHKQLMMVINDAKDIEDGYRS